MTKEFKHSQPEHFSIAEKKQRENRQRNLYKEIFGINVNIKPYPKEITPLIEQNLKNWGFQLFYIGGINPGTLENLQKNGVDSHLAEIKKKYPKLVLTEDLTNNNISDPKIPRLPEKNFWQAVLEEKTEFPEPLNDWVALEITSASQTINSGEDKLLKELGLDSRTKNYWSDVIDTLSSTSTSFLSKKIGLPATDEKLGILSLFDRSIIGNLTGIDTNSKKLEFTNTYNRSYPDPETIYTTGLALSGGSGCAVPVNPNKPSNSISFRTAIFF